MAIIAITCGEPLYYNCNSIAFAYVLMIVNCFYYSPLPSGIQLAAKEVKIRLTIITYF